MPPEVMTLHAVSREIRPTSIAPGLKLFLKDTPTLHRPDPYTALTMPPPIPPTVLRALRAPLHRAGDVTGNTHGLPKNTPPIFSVNSARQPTA